LWRWAIRKGKKEKAMSITIVYVGYKKRQKKKMEPEINQPDRAIKIVCCSIYG
jgi:hypothetical protein